MPTRHADRLMPTLRRAVLGRQAASRTDGELVTAFVLTGEGDAFGELVRRHGAMVLGVCRRLIPDHATADDAFQAVFLVLARRAGTVRPREQVGNYLYGVAYRTALKARTALARRRSREKQVDPMPEPTAPAAAPAWSDVQPILDEELARLPEKLRTAVVLCDLEGRAQREVAKHLGVPPATLATRLASARRTLAARLTRRGLTLSGGALAGLMAVHASASAVPYPLSAGVVRAAEALAAGGPVTALVSAQVVQLSEGVMQMMMLAKLKAVAVATVVALALTTGMGLGLVPATAKARPVAEEREPKPPAAPGTASEGRTWLKEKLKEEPEADDVLFLRRLSLDVRGTVPTDVETWFFVSDEDNEKRAKVIEWLTDDDAARAAVAKKLGVPIERVRIVRARVEFAPDGKNATVRLGEKVGSATATEALPKSLAFSADGRFIAKDGPVKVLVNDAANKKAAQNLTFWATVTEEDKPAGAFRVWATQFAGEQKNEGSSDLWLNTADPNQGMLYSLIRRNPIGDNGPTVVLDYLVGNTPVDTDAEFLKRALTDARGNGPTTLELKYFTEDKDPKKREKLLDAILKEPAVQKKLGDEWKKKMLTLKTAQLTTEAELFYFLLEDQDKDKSRLNMKLQRTQPFVVPDATKPPAPPAPPTPPTALTVVFPPAAPANKIEKLVEELLAAQKSDEALLEAVTLATMSRLPTDAEKKLTLAAVGSAPDRKTAWVAVARALAGSDTKKVDVIRPRVAPVPPAKP